MRPRRQALASIVALNTLAAPTWAFWFMRMGSLTVSRLDPIVTPGLVAPHNHDIWGGSAFSAWSTTSERMRKSSCTSAPVAQDFSNYWAPTLYFARKDGKLERVKSSLVVFYDWSSNFKPVVFPEDFQLISGDPTLSTYNDTDPNQQAIKHVCIQPDGTEDTTPGLPEKDCKAGLRGDITFPSCGQKGIAQAKDHKSHLTWPVDADGKISVKGGDCPDTHPDRYATLVYQVFFDTKPFSSRRGEAANPKQPFIYSTGDVTGYSLHADYTYAWNPVTLKAALEICGTDAGDTGTVESCNKIWTPIDADACKKPSDVDELSDGVVPHIPGCFEVPGAPTPTCTKAKLKPTSAQCRPKSGAGGSLFGGQARRLARRWQLYR